jgi:trigger factor
MNLKQEKIDDLNALIKVQLNTDDYAEKVQKTLKDYQKNAAMPGFRKGKVPASLIKKMYGKAIIIDEVNKTLNDSIYNFLKENNIEILGQPLPKNDDQQIDWDNQTEFEFTYELGMMPEFTPDLENLQGVSVRMLKIDDEMLNKEIRDIQRRYGKVHYPEKVEAEDMVYADFTELDEAGNLLEGGISKNAPIFLGSTKNEALKNSLLGLAKGDHLQVNPFEVWDTDGAVARNLGIKEDQLAGISKNFRLTITNVTRIEPAELNEELFKKVYGELVTTEEEFRTRLKSELSNVFQGHSDGLFINEVIKKLIEQHQPALPEDFLKRWLVATSEKPVTLEQISSEFDAYAERLKNQIVVNRLIKQYQLEVAEKDAVDYVKEMVKNQFRNYNGYEIEEQELTETTLRVLQNQKEYERIMDKLYENRLMQVMKEKVKFTIIEQPIDEFYK